MPLSIHQIAEKRRRLATLVDESNGILQKCGGTLDAESEAKVDRIHTDAEALKAEIERDETELDTHQRRLERETRQARIASDLARGRQIAGDERELIVDADPDLARSGSRAAGDAAAFKEQRRAAVRRYLTDGYGALTLQERALLRPPATMLEEMREADPAGYRAAVGSATDATLGYLVPAESLQPMVTARKYFGGMREVADTFETDNGREIPYPTTDDTANEGRYVGENKAVTETSAGTVGIVPIKAFTCTSDTVLVPAEFLQDVGIDFDSWLMGRFAERIGRRSSRAFTTGDGSLGPLGCLTSATLGVTTATGQTTRVKFTDLTDLEHAVDIAYRGNFILMGHDLTIAALKKELDSTGRPLWQTSVAVGEPDTINGRRYVVNNDLATPAASAKVLLGGDFSNYKIRTVRARIVKRLEERYAENNQIGFVLYERHDGRLIDAGQHPVKYLQLAAS